MIAGAFRPRPTPTTGVVTLRHANGLDASRVLAWNGAPEVRARSMDPRPITTEAHARWFAARLRDPRGGLWIAQLDGCPIGVVRVDRDDHDVDSPGRISIVLDPSVRGRGLGRQVIALACAADGGPVVADILADNHASRTSFEAAGFVQVPSPSSPAPASSRAALRYLWRPLRVHL